MINLREKNFKLFKVAISTVFNNIKQTMIQVNFKKKKKEISSEEQKLQRRTNLKFYN